MNASSRCALNSNVAVFHRNSRVALCAVAFLALASQAAEAGPVLTFNTLNADVNSATGTDPIETYIESVIGSNVTVYLGAKTLKYEPESGLSAQWLGNTEYVNGVLTNNQTGVRDTYLINRWNSSTIASNLRDRIKIYFDVAVSSIEFDWQIFPTTGNEADLTVKGDGVQYFYYNNIAQKTAGKLGHTLITFNAPVNLIEFIDWDTAPIGIDNLQLNPPPPNQQVPEPATGLMALLGGLGIAAVRRRRAAAAA